MADAVIEAYNRRCLVSRYCWPTPKCRNLCVQHAFFEGKKAEETSPRKSALRTLNQIPPDLVVKYQPIDIVDVILWRVLRPRFVLQREIKGRATLTP